MPLKNRGPIVPAVAPEQNGASITLPEAEAPVPHEAANVPETATDETSAPTTSPTSPAPDIPVQERVQRTLDPSLVPGKMSPRGFVPKGHIELVDCDLYEDMALRVGFNTSIGYRILRDNYYGPGETPVERECRRILLICPVWEGWNVVDPLDGSPIPPPDPRNWETYKSIVTSAGLMSDLYMWIVGEGLTKALRQAAGNS